MSITAMKQWLEALETAWYHVGTFAPTDEAIDLYDEAITSLRQAIAKLESQEPVAWLITDESINHLQVESIQKLIDRAIHAHMTDIKLRINGQDEWYEADWLKHMTRTSPPQRQWVGLTDDEINLIYAEPQTHIGQYARAIEAKLKEKNT